MVPNTKALVALGLAFVAGASTTPLMIAGRSPDPGGRATGSGSPAEPDPASRTWEDPTIAKPTTATPAQVVSREERRRSAAAAPGRLPSPRPRPREGDLRAERTVTAMRQPRPLVASAHDSLPEIVPPPARRQTLADASAIDGSASNRVRPVGDAPVQRTVQRLAGNFKGQGATRPVRGGDGLLRWLSE
jgi:hypothetical protein